MEFAMVTVLAALIGGPQIVSAIFLLIVGLYLKDFFRDELRSAR